MAKKKGKKKAAKKPAKKATAVVAPAKKATAKKATAKKTTVRLRDLSNKPAWKHAKDAGKLPKTGKADTFQNFAVAAASVDKDLVIHKGKNGFSIHHPNRGGMLMGVGGSATTLRLTSELFDPKKDRGCKRDVKGYPTIVIENPTEDEVQHFSKQLVKRQKTA